MSFPVPSVYPVYYPTALREIPSLIVDIREKVVLLLAYGNLVCGEGSPGIPESRETLQTYSRITSGRISRSPHREYFASPTERLLSVPHSALPSDPRRRTEATCVTHAVLIFNIP